MEYIHKLEAYLAPLHDKAPHISARYRQWIATNAWWLVLTIVIIGALCVMAVLIVALVLGALVGLIVGDLAGSVVGGSTALVVLFICSVLITNLVIGALAISPLKNKQKKGWSLLLLAMAISLVFSIFGLLLTFDIIGFIRDALFAVIGGYLLFEIRGYFASGNAGKSQKHVQSTEI